MADDKTAAERAAEEALQKHESEVGWANLSPEAYSSFEAGFAAGAAWRAEQARPVLTREQRERIAEAIWRSDLDYEPQPEAWSALTDSYRDEYRVNADAVLALLAQGDVPAQTTDPTPWVCDSASHSHPRRTAEDCGRGTFAPRAEYDPTSNVSRAFSADREAAIRADQRERDKREERA